MTFVHFNVEQTKQKIVLREQRRVQNRRNLLYHRLRRQMILWYLRPRRLWRNRMSELAFFRR